MPNESLVNQILEDLLNSHRTPEEACGGDPELLREVRARWERIQLVDHRIGALFPLDALTRHEATVPADVDINLPIIAGYEVTEILGRGGMGIVFKARHLKLNRFVAMKMLLGGKHAGPPELARFRREAEAVAALRHPNIVQVHDVGEVSSGPFFTMEFVEGGSLARALHGKTFPPREAARLVATLACGVQFAHKSGFIHRDLKPGNILLTEDGTPKITDFGLVRPIDGPEFTLPGARVGTLSYMAPEQALGKTNAIGPAVDIYALGAVLYELLTGRPPFQGSSVAETERQLLHDEPVPPSRHNPKVPRDLETICLKCLSKESGLRYATADALNDDLSRFLRGDAISAMPEGRMRRAMRTVRRRPTLTVGVSAGVLFAALILAAGLWLLFDRLVTDRAVTSDLDEIEELLQKSSFTEGKAAIERAQGRLGTREAPALRQRLNQLLRDWQLADRLEQIYLNSVITIHGLIKFNQADKDYGEAFREFGVGKYGDDPETVAAQVRKSNIRTTLLAALDRWSVVATTRRDRASWVVEVASRAEPEPTAWRKDARNRELRRNRTALFSLIKRARVEGESVPLLLALSSLLTTVNKRPPNPIGLQVFKRTLVEENESQASFLTKVQRAHPDDLWANLYLGQSLLNGHKPDEAVRYFQAVIALRPRLLIGYHHLGVALGSMAKSGSPERRDEAIVQLRKGLKIDPNSVYTHFILISQLWRAERYDEAIVQVRDALRLNHQVARLRSSLGTLLCLTGQVKEGLPEFRLALSLEPDNPDVLNEYRTALTRTHRWKELRPVWGKVLQGDRPNHDYWHGYAELCLYLGQEDEYRRARQALLARFGTSDAPQIAKRTARACLLLPASEEEMSKAVSLADLAARADPKKFASSYPSFQFVKGLAEYRQGHFDRAIAILRGDASKMPGPSPKLVLSMALHRTGKEAEARKTFASAMLNHSWHEHRVTGEDGWIRHVLRREAESMIVPNLTAMLEGKQLPRDNDERIAQIGACRFENRFAALARIYADAFATKAKRTTIHLQNAACVAVQAGCGRGIDAGGLSEAERRNWRAQARTWLREALSAMIRATDRDFNKAHGGVHKDLKGWQNEPELAGIRDPSELEKLLPDEQADCRKLWAEVNAVLDSTSKPK